MRKSTVVVAYLFADTLCKQIVCIHVDKLIFKRRTARVYNENFHNKIYLRNKILANFSHKVYYILIQSLFQDFFLRRQR